MTLHSGLGDPGLVVRASEKGGAGGKSPSTAEKASARARVLRDLNLLNTTSPLATRRSGASDRGLSSEISVSPHVQAALELAMADVGGVSHEHAGLDDYNATTRSGRAETNEEKRKKSGHVDLMPVTAFGASLGGALLAGPAEPSGIAASLQALLRPGVEFDPKTDKIDAAYQAFHREVAVSAPSSSYGTGGTGADGWDYSTTPNVGAFARNPVDLGLKQKWTVPAGTAAKGLGVAVGSKAELRKHLAGAIDVVAHRYAKEAGVEAPFMRKALDGTAVIESRYGVLRQVGGGAVPYESSAGGAFHMTNGHVQEMVNRYGTRPEIAEKLAELGVKPGQKLSKTAAWQIKENDEIAASFVALEMADQLKQNPGLRGDVNGAAALSYMHHNMGHGGAKALLKGGLAALERVDHRVDNNNPMFFRGARSADDVVDRYQSHMAGAIEAADKYRVALADPKTDTQVALRHDPKPRPQILAMAMAPAPGLH